MQGVTIEVRWDRDATQVEREHAAHILEAVIRALRASGTSGSFRGGGSGTAVAAEVQGTPPVCGCLGAGCEGPADSERHVAPTEPPRATDENPSGRALRYFGQDFRRHVADPGTYGPGDFGPDSFGGSDYP